MSKVKRLWFFTLVIILLITGCSSAQNATTQAPDNPQKSLPESEAAVNAAMQAIAFPTQDTN
jgi:PBP1b-binding outer membrane lipoprotein LpoB